MNDDTTDVIVVSTPFYKSIASDIRLIIGDETISPSNSTRNLGVLFDRFMNMEDHIKQICRSSYAQLHGIRKIKPLLTPEALCMVVHAFITSRIDYCNSLLIGVSQQQIQRLQRIQNMAARLVSGAGKYDYITPVLKALHWLPVSERIQFKVLLLTYRALNGLAPVYLTDLLSTKSSIRTLRSSSRVFLNVPRTRLSSYGDAAFGVAAAKLWNSLPQSISESKTISQFKSALKTHMFIKAFNNM